MTTSGTVLVETGSILEVVGGSYLQTAGSTLLASAELIAPTVDLFGGVLNGKGQVTTTGGLTNSGVVDPGTASPGILTILGNYTQTASGSLAVTLNGTVAGVDYDQLVVNGQVTLAGSLTATLGFASATGNVYRIVDNDGFDSFAGAFAGLAELTLGGRKFQISYVGGTGNDVTLTDAGAAPANTPPAANAGGPYAIVEGNPLTLDATASSDPDGDVLTFTWDVNGDGLFGDATGAQPTLTWDDLVALGIEDGPYSGNAVVRVADGINPAVTSAPATLAIANAAPETTASLANIAILDAPVTFQLAPIDVAADLAADFTYEFDWDGNGAADESAVGPGNFTIDHVFSIAGPFEVQIRATDKDGGVGPWTTLRVQVRQSALVDDPLNPGQLMLVVIGSTADDNIRVAAGPNPGDVRVRINGHFEGPYQPESRIVIHGRQGNDIIFVNREITLPAWLYGDSENDSITGGRGPNVILGGSGNDSLTGRGQRDILVGGSGRDTLIGGAGDDLLIAGTTTLDESALFAVQAEWLSTHSYANRVANLTNQANPDFANRLNNGVYLLANVVGATVSDDGAVDVLNGGGGLDACFGNTGPVARDRITAQQPSELTIDI